MPLKPLARNSRVSDLPPSAMSEIKRNLDPHDKWKDVIEFIVDEHGNEKFTQTDVSNFEMELRRNKSPTEAMLRVWSFCNPTLQDLLHVFAQAEMISLIHVFLVKKMKEMTDDEFDVQSEVGWTDYFLSSKDTSRDIESVHECRFSGPAVPNEGANLNPDFRLTEPEERPTEPLNTTADIKFKLFPYDNLSTMTDNFNVAPVSQGGRLIGVGGYAHVFLGKFPGKAAVAVKKLKKKDKAEKQFFKEVDTLRHFAHENILPIVGVSQDGPEWCIITEFMENGSLEDRLACKNDTDPLSFSERIRICKGIAQGINYLHTFEKIPYIHRDIKSANILLDYDFSPKIGDCGLVHFGPSKLDKSYTVTEEIVGTTAYMPPEYFYGQISEKLDAFSFGVIMFEILTALPAYDPNRPSKSLKTYVKEYCRENRSALAVKNILDQRVSWNLSVVNHIYMLAERLTVLERHDRPTVTQVLPEIMSWSAH